MVSYRRVLRAAERAKAALASEQDLHWADALAKRDGRLLAAMGEWNSGRQHQFPMTAFNTLPRSVTRYGFVR